MDAHGLPSGGDWALQPQGVITVKGTENLTIKDCLFTSVATGMRFLLEVTIGI